MTGHENGNQALLGNSGLPYAGIRNQSTLGAFGVEECAAILRRFELVHRKLVYLEAAHLVNRSSWELKTALGRHLYEDAEAAASLRERVLDLRQNANVLSRDPDQRLSLMLDELLHAENDFELLIGLYEIVKPALLAAEQEYARTTQPLVDEPSIRLLRSSIADLDEQVAWGRAAIHALVDEGGMRNAAESYAAHLNGFLVAAGGIDGRGASADEVAGRRWRSHRPFELSMTTIRDSRFPQTIVYRHGAPDAGEGDETRQRLVNMMRVRQEEMNVAELLSSVIWLKQDQPWEFTLDIARHEWDEMRHCIFGQAALDAEGIDWMSYPQFTGDYDLNASNLADAQYAWLFGIESLLMAKTGKRAEYEFCRDIAKHPLMTQFQDFDWADEVKHVHIGRKWSAELYDGDISRAREAGDRAIDEFFKVTDQATFEALGYVPTKDWRKKAVG